MSTPALRLLHGGQSPDPSLAHDLRVVDGAEGRKPTGRTAQPYWWRWIVIQSLRHGSWFPPLWPAKKIFRLLRSRSIRRAMQTLAMQGELGFDGRPNFSFIEAFVHVEAKRRADPAFSVASERALRIGRVTIAGLPVILDDEIDGRGQNAFIRHFAWTVSTSRAHPLPPWLKPS